MVRPVLLFSNTLEWSSVNPAEPPAIRFNFLSAEHDRRGVLAAIRKGRELMAMSPMREVTGDEIAPGAHLQKDDELLDWVRKNAETTYHPIGTKKPNAWGLYDMLGNVEEWIGDWYGVYPNASGVVTDPTGPVGDGRVERGGAWNVAGDLVRVAARNGYDPAIRDGAVGFRP